MNFTLIVTTCGIFFPHLFSYTCKVTELPSFTTEASCLYVAQEIAGKKISGDIVTTECVKTPSNAEKMR